MDFLYIGLTGSMSMHETSSARRERNTFFLLPKKHAILKIYVPEIWSAERSFHSNTTATNSGSPSGQSRGSEKIVKWIGSLLRLKASRVTA